MLVYKDKYGHWTTPCNTQLPNGEKHSYYLQVQFKRGKEPTKEKINIKVDSDGSFYSCYLKKDNSVAPKLVVMDWQEVQLKKMVRPDGTETTYEEYKNEKNINIDSDALPFY